MREFIHMTTPELQAMWSISRQVTERRAAKLGFERVQEDKPGGGYRNVYLVPQSYLDENTTAPIETTAPTATTETTETTETEKDLDSCHPTPAANKLSAGDPCRRNDGNVEIGDQAMDGMDGMDSMDGDSAALPGLGGEGDGDLGFRSAPPQAMECRPSGTDISEQRTECRRNLKVHQQRNYRLHHSED